MVRVLGASIALPGPDAILGAKLRSAWMKFFLNSGVNSLPMVAFAGRVKKSKKPDFLIQFGPKKGASPKKTDFLIQFDPAKGTSPVGSGSGSPPLLDLLPEQLLDQNVQDLKTYYFSEKFMLLRY